MYYELNLEKTKCELNPFAQILNLDDFIEIISSNITYFVDSSTIINGSDFKEYHQMI